MPERKGEGMSENTEAKMPAVRTLTCPYIKACGGCKTIGQPYVETLEKKRKALDHLLRPYARIEEIIGMEDPYHYRNKVHWTYTMQMDRFNRNLHVAGIYAAGSHKVVPIKACLIENEEADAIMRDIFQIARKYKMRFYDEDLQEGLLRHVLIRTAHATGQIMVVLVLSDRDMPGKKNFIQLLRKKHPAIRTVVINVNNKRTSMILGDHETVAYGPGYIEDELCGKRFRISPKSFYQVNSVQTEKLYQAAIEYAGLTGKETVVDAYCGIGTIGICAASKAANVIGCELNADAVEDARRNAQQNNVSNISFVNADAGEFLTDLKEQGEKVDVIFLDPPRSGATEEFLDAAAAIAPRRIIYISCGPETLLRDLKYLKKKGYKAVAAKGCDMFPFTEHTEAVCLLTHAN